MRKQTADVVVACGCPVHLQKKASRDKEQGLLTRTVKELEAMRRHNEVLARSHGEEKEMRLRESKKRKATEQLMKALRTRSAHIQASWSFSPAGAAVTPHPWLLLDLCCVPGRVSYLTEVVEEAALSGEGWEVERRVMKEQLKSLLKGQETLGIPQQPPSRSAGAVDGDEDMECSGDSVVWVTAAETCISDVTVLLSIHEIVSTKCLRVTAFDPLKVRATTIMFPCFRHRMDGVSFVMVRLICILAGGGADHRSLFGASGLQEEDRGHTSGTAGCPSAASR